MQCEFPWQLAIANYVKKRKTIDKKKEEENYENCGKLCKLTASKRAWENLS